MAIGTMTAEDIISLIKSRKFTKVPENIECSDGIHNFFRRNKAVDYNNSEPINALPGAVYKSKSI